jgi:hypothetical protein
MKNEYGKRRKEGGKEVTKFEMASKDLPKVCECCHRQLNTEIRTAGLTCRSHKPYHLNNLPCVRS